MRTIDFPRRGYRARGPAVLTWLIAICAALALLVVPSTAQAASGDPGTISATQLRSCPDNRCGVVRSLPASTVAVRCWRDAGSAYGTVRWFRVNAAGATGWVSAGRMPRQPSVPYCSDLLPDEVLFAGQQVWSSNGRYQLVMQSDGNLVSYGPGGAIWSSRTYGGSDRRLVVQGDGNLVVYNGANTALWNAGTMVPGANLVMQDDGNLVDYAGGRAWWATSWYSRGGIAQAKNSAAWGWCTWYAYERFKQASGIYPNLSGGDAWQWDDIARGRGWSVVTSPVTGSIVVFEKYVQGAGNLGHVGWVDAVRRAADATPEIHVVEMNFSAGFGRVSDRWVRHVAGMSYVAIRAL